MAEVRRNGAGSRLSGVLERSTPLSAESPDPGDFDPPAQPAESPDPDPAAPAPRTAVGQGGRKPKAAESRAAKKVKGHTIYLHDDLFERLLVQSHRRGKTISEYVAALVERQVPDHRAGGRSAATGPE